MNDVEHCIGDFLIVRMDLSIDCLNRNREKEPLIVKIIIFRKTEVLKMYKYVMVLKIIK